MAGRDCGARGSDASSPLRVHSDGLALDSRTPRTTSTSRALLVGFAHQRIHQRRTGFRVIPVAPRGRGPATPNDGTPAGSGFAAPWPASPTGKFRARLTAMAARRGVAVIGVDAAYTSRWGTRHWRPLCNSRLLTRPPSPAIMARRPRSVDVEGLAIRRHSAGPRNGGGPFWALHRAGPDRQPAHAGRYGSSGPPTRTRCAPVHQRTPARCGQHRSERNRAEQTAAHKERLAPLRCRRWRQVIDSVAAKAALIAGGRICCRRRRALQHRSPAWCSRLRRRRLNLGWVDYRVGLGLFARCDRGVAGIPRCSSGRNRHWHW